MDHLIKKLSELDLVRGDFDYHATRVAMIIVFFVFSCQKWFDYEAHALIPFISNGPLIFWLYPVFGVRGAAYFLGSAELLFGLLLLLGFWSRRLAILGSLGSCATYVATVTIIPFFGRQVALGDKIIQFCPPEFHREAPKTVATAAPISAHPLCN